jgi:predicted enzyme related to lactoylglutathione lyase
MPVPGIGWLAYVKDPDGNILGLMQSDANAR